MKIVKLKLTETGHFSPAHPLAKAGVPHPGTIIYDVVGCPDSASPTEVCLRANKACGPINTFRAGTNEWATTIQYEDLLRPAGSILRAS